MKKCCISVNDISISSKIAYSPYQNLREILNLILGIEIISSDLTTARNNIDQIIGAKTNEDMLDKLFGNFVW